MYAWNERNISQFRNDPDCYNALRSLLSLRKRFQQNQEDCTYHVLALVPSLGNAILEEMDVERITLALQQQRAGGRPTAAGASHSGLSAAASNPADHNASLLLPGSTLLTNMTDSMLSSATTSDHDASSASSSSVPPQNSDSRSHSRSRSQGENEPQLDTSVLLNASSNDWVAEFQAQLAREDQEHGRTSDGESPSESMLLLSGTQTSMSLPESDEQRSESGAESVSAQSGVVRNQATKRQG